jgi:hypothetical protein
VPLCQVRDDVPLSAALPPGTVAAPLSRGRPSLDPNRAGPSGGAHLQQAPHLLPHRLQLQLVA